MPGDQLRFAAELADFPEILRGGLTVHVSAQHECIPGEQFLQDALVLDAKQLSQASLDLLPVIVREDFALEGEIESLQPAASVRVVGNLESRSVGLP